MICEARQAGLPAPRLLSVASRTARLPVRAGNARTQTGQAGKGERRGDLDTETRKGEGRKSHGRPPAAIPPTLSRVEHNNLRPVILGFLLAAHAVGGGKAADLEGIEVLPPAGVRGAFLERGVGARPVGMAGAFAAIADDASALTVNPGGLGQLGSLDVVVMYGLLGNDQGLSYVSAALPAGPGVAGIGLVALDYGEYDRRGETGARMGTGTAMDAGVVAGYAFPSPQWLGGRGFSGLSLEVTKEEAGGSMFGLGLGGILPVGSRLAVGWALEHLGLPRDGFSLPAVAKLAGSYRALESLRVAADIAYPLVDRQPWIAFGGEYSPVRMAAVRAGYRMETASREIEGLTGLTLGIGFRIGAFGLDYAYQPFGDLATSHRISLAYGTRRPVADRRSRGTEARGGDAARDSPGPGSLVPVSPVPATDAAYSDSVRLYSAGDYDGAWRKAYEVIRFDPRHWQAWAMIGNCQYAKGDVAGALVSYRQSLAINPANEQLRAWVSTLEGR